MSESNSSVSAPGPLPPEFTFIQRGWLNCNSIIIQGDGPPALVDSGHLHYQDETLELIRQAGVEPESIGQIAVTHAHCDHHGANKTLKAMSGATVGMGPLTAEWFASGEQHLTWFEQFSQAADVVPADVVYHDGDTISLSGIPFKVIALPGHAPDCIGYYQPDEQILIGADAMWENDVGVLHTAVHGPDILADAELAVRKIIDLDPKVVIPGHGNLITNPAENGERILQRLTSFRAEPSRAAWHIMRRLTMYSLMAFQPIVRDDYLAQLVDNFWGYEYLDGINAGSGRTFARSELDQLINQIIDEFIGRGLVAEENNFLICYVSK